MLLSHLTKSRYTSKGTRNVNDGTYIYIMGAKCTNPQGGNNLSEIVLRNVCKEYNKGNMAVKDFNLDIKDKEFVIFVGPSGCGKSTTLRMIAGLEEISNGELYIDGNLVNYVEPQGRDLAMVFQNYALYPHMTVFENMAFSLKIRKVPKNEIKERVHEAAKILGIEQLLDRRSGDLSGGQKQRVAIGSAIMRQPKAFLMDEPLSNLDAKLRAQMRIELAKLHERLGTTIIYVTHDQTEAMTLGTRIVVMLAGEIQQAAAPEVLYNNPINKFVAGFIGSPAMNFARMKVTGDAADVVLEREEFRIQTKDRMKETLLDSKLVGREVDLGIRPENIYTEAGKAKAVDLEFTDAIQAEVVTRELVGAEVILYVDWCGVQLCARVEPENEDREGDKINLYLDCNCIKLFDVETEKNLMYWE